MSHGHPQIRVRSFGIARTLLRCSFKAAIAITAVFLGSTGASAQYQQQYQQQYPQQQQYQQQYPQQQQYQQQYPQQQYPQQQQYQQQYPQQQYPQQQQYQQQYPQQQYPQQQYPPVGDQVAGEDSAEEDPFAFQEAAPQTSVRLEAGLGVGIGLHNAKLPMVEGTQQVNGHPFFMGTAFALLEAKEPDSVGYGLRLAYRTSVAQKATADVPPVDQSPAPPVTEPVSSQARKQEITVDGLIRVPLDDDDTVSIPLWIGGGILGFNTDQKTPIIEYTLGDVHLQPSLRISAGPVEVELGGLAGVAFPLDEQLPRSGFSGLGFLFGGQLGLDVQLADPLLAFVQARYRQTQFSATQVTGSFSDMFLAITVGAAARF